MEMLNDKLAHEIESLIGHRFFGRADLYALQKYQVTDSASMIHFPARVSEYSARPAYSMSAGIHSDFEEFMGWILLFRRKVSSDQ